MSTRERVTVTDGLEVFRIAPERLSDATARGLSHPVACSQTLVGNGEYLFEIPLEDAETAQADGLQDLLVRERTQWFKRESGSVQAPPPTSRHQEPAIDVPDEAVLMEGLSQAEQEAEAERELQQQELDETEGWQWFVLRLKFWIDERRQFLVSQLRGSGISVAVHVALLLILASLFMKVEDDELKGLVISAAPPSSQPIQEVIIEPTPLEITEPTESIESESPAPAEVVRAEAVTAPNFMESISGAAIKPPASSAAAGTGKARPTKKPSFFGRRVAAVDYVFVIDNSNSMTKGRFETALNELLIAVNQLTAKQRFYVLFYSDTAYPLFYPKSAAGLVPATTKNKALLRSWLNTVQLCLKTNGKEAISAAFALQPDVIFVLGDGAFTDNAASHFAAQPQKKIPLHTLGMEVKPKDAIGFQKLAKANGGTYKDVGVAQGALALSMKFPRNRNNTRGPIWGVTLRPKPVLK